MMNEYLKQLEQPQPKIALSDTRFEIEGAGIVEGSFEVTNIGEGSLAGQIASASDILSFSCENFEGNSCVIEYKLVLEGLFGHISAAAVVTSNGGEKILSFDIFVNPPPLNAPGAAIATVEHFMEYAKTRPADAARLFGRQEFMLWLFNTGYPAMDVYEIFAADPNKERGMDNFLIFCGEKTKARLVAPKSINITIGRWEGARAGAFALRRSAWGYVEGNISLAKEVPWLKLSKTKITGADFDGMGNAEVDYIIFPENLAKGHTATAVINIENETQQMAIAMRCKPAAPFDAALDKEMYLFEDTGKINLRNNTGRDLMVDIFCEGFVRFNAKRYFISESAEIGFDIKFSTLKAATMSLRKQLYVNTQIHVMSVGGVINYTAKLPVTLWNR